jgi:hypothetical protein
VDGIRVHKVEAVSSKSEKVEHCMDLEHFIPLTCMKRSCNEVFFRVGESSGVVGFQVEKATAASQSKSNIVWI